MRRQDRLDRGQQRLTHDLELLSQTVGAFLRIWLAHSPPLPKEARAAAIGRADQGYRQVLQRVADQVLSGRRFVDDLPPEYFASEQAMAIAPPGQRASTDENRGEPTVAPAQPLHPDRAG
jgi:hypothetical protein